MVIRFDEENVLSRFVSLLAPFPYSSDLDAGAARASALTRPSHVSLTVRHTRPRFELTANYTATLSAANSDRKAAPGPNPNRCSVPLGYSWDYVDAGPF